MGKWVPVQGRPGVFRDEASGQTYMLNFTAEDSRYDTIHKASGQLTAGASVKWFDDKTNKNELDANFPSTGKLVSRSEVLEVERIGLEMPLVAGATIVAPQDIKRWVSNTRLRIQINKQLVTEGPAIKYGSGFGFSGQTNENAQGILSIGVPSTAAASKLLEKLYITDDHQVYAYGYYDDRLWISGFAMPTLGGAVQARLYFHGLLHSAATVN